jgi:iron complex outermembrane recepter protein
LKALYLKYFLIFTLLFTFFSGDAQTQYLDTLLPKQLDSVFIRSQFRKDRSSYQSARINIPDYENPQVTTSVGTSLTKNRNYYTQTAMLANAAGVTPSWAGVAPYFTIRGFRTRSNFRNGLNAYLHYSDENSNVQQLDVIKGPSGTLFGGTNMAFGGLINVLTYIPVDSIFTNFSLATGNNALHRANIEINTPLDSAHKSLFRMFGTYISRKSFQDQGLNKGLFLAPSFSYQLSPDLKIRMEAEFLHRNTTNNPLFTPSNPLIGGIATNVQHSNDLNLDYYSSYTNNSLLWRTSSLNFYGKISYAISPDWQSETNLASTNSTSNGDYQTNLLANNNAAVARKVLHYESEDISNYQVQQNFIGNFKIGGWANKLLIGLDYQRYSYGANYKNAGYVDTVAIAGPSAAANLFHADLIRNLVVSKQPNNSVAPQNSYSAYVSDVIKPTDALTLMLSARYDRLINLGTKDLLTAVTTGDYKQSSITPKIGLTYQLIPKVITVFGNYMSGFQNLAPTSANGIVYNFKPQYGSQLESGVKIAVPNNALDLTLSYYDIRVRNSVITDPEDATKYIQGGKQYSRGVEFDIQSEPLSNFFIHAGGAYNTSKLTVADAAVQGLRPVNAGPKWSFTWYASYELPVNSDSRWNAGFGGNYAGEDLIINSKSAGSFYTNAYTLCNGNIGYAYRQFQCRLTSENLFNTRYYYGGRGFITPGNLRQCILSMTLRF